MLYFVDLWNIVYLRHSTWHLTVLKLELVLSSLILELCWFSPFLSVSLHGEQVKGHMCLTIWERKCSAWDIISLWLGTIGSLFIYFFLFVLYVSVLSGADESSSGWVKVKSVLFQDSVQLSGLVVTSMLDFYELLRRITLCIPKLSGLLKCLL